MIDTKKANGKRMHIHFWNYDEVSFAASILITFGRVRYLTEGHIITNLYDATDVEAQKINANRSWLLKLCIL